MLTVWRLVSKKFSDTAFSGDGARLYGGRWNRKGTLIVYTAGSQSLAMLEMLVQDEPLRAQYVMIPARLPANLKLDRIKSNELPTDWRSLAAREALQEIGTAWAASNSSAVLCVPSAVIPDESNYLLNPLHPSFKRIIIGTAQEFTTDLRLHRN